jgi:hypothetical protein
MFYKTCVFVALSGVSFAALAETPQILTSEVFGDSRQETIEYVDEQQYEEYAQPVTEDVPVWPLAGSEADVEIACAGTECSDENKIVTKVGSNLVIENNFHNVGTGWSGGPNIYGGFMVPAGFDYECANKAEMPLMRREMMEDDGGTVLAMSRSPRKMCGQKTDSYSAFAEKAGFKPSNTCNKVAVDDEVEVAVNEYAEEENIVPGEDNVRSWVIVDGQTLREVLQSWCDKSGWDLVWTTAREYPIEASAVFKGRFVDVASALVRNFERATPVPYAKFYKGNRVVVVSTSEE